MEKRALELFPYSPYSVQKEFVHELVKTLSCKNSVGIFESPTGTGKTTSLLCGALSWIINTADDDDRENMELLANKDAELFTEEPDWVREARKSLPVPFNDKGPRSKEKTNKRKKVDHDLDVDPVTAILSIMKEDEEDSGKLKSLPKPPKRVFYCSRTHSQLSQVMSEVNRIISKNSNLDNVKAISLASRKNLCIHEKVKKLDSSDRINRKCQELLEEDSCSYYNKDKSADLNNFVTTLPAIADIEELLSRGRAQNVCPYYGSRMSFIGTEITCLPYNMILSKTTREALELDLAGSVIIFDEAHNLIDTINEMNSCTVKFDTFEIVSDALCAYRDKFTGRLMPENLVKLQQLLHIVVQIKSQLRSIADEQAGSGLVSKVNDFLMKCGIDHINLYPIIEYIKTSHLSAKLVSFYPREIVEIDGEAHGLTMIEKLLSCLTLSDSDGRLIASNEQTAPSLKYVALSPALVMKEIQSEAHSIILAGGTMSPMDDVISQLFPSGMQPTTIYSASRIIPSRNIINEATVSTMNDSIINPMNDEMSLLFPSKISISAHTFNHLVPSENCPVAIMTKGPAGEDFKFTHATRDNIAMFNDLGQAIVNVCNVVPDGVTVFFPSFGLLDHFLSIWPIASKSHVKKQIFIEVSGAADHEKVLNRYQHACHNGGALFLAVMGGRLSEGINFADRLCRGLLIVGLPFPNPNDLETKQRASFYSSIRQNDNPTESETEYYENVCMRTVNQTIGRAIRHRNDYAMIMLLDSRYTQSRIRSKLSKWLWPSLPPNLSSSTTESSTITTTFPTVFANLVNFIRSKKVK